MNADRPAEGVVIVRGSGEGFAQEIVAGSHRFISDEPARLEEPTPVLHHTVCFWRRLDLALR
jgi:hypothetical protein